MTAAIASAMIRLLFYSPETLTVAGMTVTPAPSPETARTELWRRYTWRRGRRSPDKECVLPNPLSADEIDQKFSNGGPLERFIADGKLLIAVVKDYWAGRYKKILYWVIGAIVFTLLYILNPIDAIFDLLPGVGHLDDATVIGVCLYLIEKELLEYRQWKNMTSSS